MLTFSSPAHLHLHSHEVLALYSQMFDLANTTSLQFFDASNSLLGTFFAPPFPVETKHFPSSDGRLAALLFQESASLMVTAPSQLNVASRSCGDG
jgi:hypothetical protein